MFRGKNDFTNCHLYIYMLNYGIWGDAKYTRTSSTRADTLILCCWVTCCSVVTHL